MRPVFVLWVYETQYLWEQLGSLLGVSSLLFLQHPTGMAITAKDFFPEFHQFSNSRSCASSYTILLYLKVNNSLHADATIHAPSNSTTAAGGCFYKNLSKRSCFQHVLLFQMVGMSSNHGPWFVCKCGDGDVWTCVWLLWMICNDLYLPGTVLCTSLNVCELFCFNISLFFCMFLKDVWCMIQFFRHG